MHNGALIIYMVHYIYICFKECVVWLHASLHFLDRYMYLFLQIIKINENSPIFQCLTTFRGSGCITELEKKIGIINLVIFRPSR